MGTQASSNDRRHAGNISAVSVNGNSNSNGGGGYRGDRWKAALGSNLESIALYRITLGVVLCVELSSRFQYLHAFYSDEG